MFSAALKGFSSNITSNYTVSTAPASTSGAWQIYDGKNKKTSKVVSIFVFERKSLEAKYGGLGGRSGATSLKQLQDEVVARIKRESNMLARLRHPSILELAEPIEDTRSGGLIFATEPVTASLADVLQEQDHGEQRGTPAGRPSKYVSDEMSGGKQEGAFELDELEIQKGLLQVAQGLEFLHESAALVHGNLTPDAIYINVKSDWKIAGFGFAGPPAGADNSSKQPTLLPSEALYHDPRLPRSVQLDLDYTSPDFAVDNSVSTAADMFSLGLLLLALYNSPHRSPLQSNNNLATYKKAFSSSLTTPSSGNNFLCSRPLPNDLRSVILPRLITRRPGERMNAREFQQSSFFDNILVSSIRFLDNLPTKTANEKNQFLRGLPKILDQFPPSVLEKKFLPALLEETKDRALIHLILQNTFKIIRIIPNSRQAMMERILPHLEHIFAITQKPGPHDRDASKDAGLVVLLDNMILVGENCNGKEFKDYILPILRLALESANHTVVDRALGCLSTVLTVLDFTTMKNDLFPIVAAVFSKTSSLGIKIKGLEAFVVLCGGTNDSNASESDDSDELSGLAARPRPPQRTMLDKYTVQERIVPLLKAIKTKEPAVMMAALAVFKQVSKIADTDFLALEALPILWSFSLGPLLNLQQFQLYMDLITKISSKIESDQKRKLRDLASSTHGSMNATRTHDLTRVEGVFGNISNSEADSGNDFERLVLGSEAADNIDMFADAATNTSRPTALDRQGYPEQPMSQWSAGPLLGAKRSDCKVAQNEGLRTMRTLDPTSAIGAQSNMQRTLASGLSSFAAMQPVKPQMQTPLWGQAPKSTGPTTSHIPVPASNQPTYGYSHFSIPPPISMSTQSPTMAQNVNQDHKKTSGGLKQSPQVKNGLEAYESLI